MRHLREIVPTALATMAVAVPGAQAHVRAGETAGGPNQAHVTSCLQAYGHLATENHDGMRVDVTSFHSLAVGLDPKDMRQLRPDCNDVDIERHTNVRIRAGGRLVGIIRNMLNPRVDDGRPLHRDAHTSRRLKCGQAVVAEFSTRASSPESDETVSSRQHVGFTVTCH